MNARAKSMLLLLITLLIGMVLGALLHARIAEQRMEQLAFLRSQPGFIRYMERAIAPQDAAQQEAIRTILDKTARSLAAQRFSMQEETRAILDSTRAELARVLTEEQMAQLEERINQGRQRFERRPGPPGRDSPPRRRRPPPQ